MSIIHLSTEILDFYCFQVFVIIFVKLTLLHVSKPLVLREMPFLWLPMLTYSVPISLNIQVVMVITYPNWRGYICAVGTEACGVMLSVQAIGQGLAQREWRKQFMKKPIRWRFLTVPTIAVLDSMSEVEGPKEISNYLMLTLYYAVRLWRDFGKTNLFLLFLQWF